MGAIIFLYLCPLLPLLLDYAYCGCVYARLSPIESFCVFLLVSIRADSFVGKLTVRSFARAKAGCQICLVGRQVEIKKRIVMV